MRPRHQSAPCVLDPSARQESPPSVVPKPQHSPKRALSPIVIHRAPAPPHWRRSCWRCDPHVLRARICPPRTHTPRGCCRWHGSADLRRHAARWRPAIKKTFLCGQRRQCPISSHQQFGRRDCAQHSATRPPGEMRAYFPPTSHTGATIRRAPCQDPERHSAALRSVCGGLAAAGEDGWALDDVAGAASTGRIGGRPHRSRCNEPASRT